MKYAIVELLGHQYKVSEGDLLKLNKTASVDHKVLLFSDDSGVLLGRPYLDGVAVDMKIEGDEKGRKLTIRRFKAKSRYHKTRGYRDSLTVVRIVSIVNKAGGKKVEKAKESKEVDKVKELGEEKESKTATKVKHQKKRERLSLTSVN